MLSIIFFDYIAHPYVEGMLRVKEERLNDSESTRYSEKSFIDGQRMRKSDCSRNVQGSTQDSLDKTMGNICLGDMVWLILLTQFIFVQCWEEVWRPSCTGPSLL